MKGTGSEGEERDTAQSKNTYIPIYFTSPITGLFLGARRKQENPKETYMHLDMQEVNRHL